MQDWEKAWQPVADRVGTDFSSHTVPPADAIDSSALRRYLEPLEFDCPLHYDREVALAQGYDGVTVPYTAALSFTIPPMWRPGQATLFPTAERDAQPAKSAVRPSFPDYFPPFTGYFATDIDIDFIRPVLLGEKVLRRGNKLMACEAKETRVGRGAFLKFEMEVVTESGEVVARMRTGSYLYTPHDQIDLEEAGQ